MKIEARMQRTHANELSRRVAIVSALAIVCHLALLLACACTRSTRSAALTDVSLREALIARGRVDQAYRDTLIAKLQTGTDADSSFVRRLAAMDSGNTRWISEIIRQQGWPAISRFGRAAEDAAFLLVQHATGDSAFMARMVDTLARAAGRRDATGEQYALLFDRVAVRAGRKQLYATQATVVGGRIVFDEIEDSASVDQRRAAIGLPPLREYARTLELMYSAKPETSPRE